MRSEKGEAAFQAVSPVLLHLSDQVKSPFLSSYYYHGHKLNRLIRYSKRSGFIYQLLRLATILNAKYMIGASWLVDKFEHYLTALVIFKLTPLLLKEKNVVCFEIQKSAVK